MDDKNKLTLDQKISHLEEELDGRKGAVSDEAASVLDMVDSMLADIGTGLDEAANKAMMELPPMPEIVVPQMEAAGGKDTAQEAQHNEETPQEGTLNEEASRSAALTPDEKEAQLRREMDELFGIGISPEKPRKKKKSAAGTIFRVLLALVLVAAVALALLLTVGKDTVPGQYVNNFIITLRGSAGGTSTGGTQQAVPLGNTEQEKAIAANASRCTSIEQVVYDPDLVFADGVDYRVEGLAGALPFEDDIWYIDEETEVVHFLPEIIGTTMQYYSLLQDKKNNDDNTVLDMITPHSRLMTNVSAIRSDPIVKRTATELRIGEIRRLNDDIYVLVRLSETTNDENPDTAVTQTVHLVVEGYGLQVYEVMDAAGQ